MGRSASRYELASTAADYRARFSKSWSRVLSNALELRMLEGALRVAGATGRILDAPCGAGRLVPALRRAARHVTCVDAAGAMLSEARSEVLRSGAAASRAPVSFARADVFMLPFADGAFDAAVCWRLLHHFPRPDSRLRLLSELRRVSRGAVVVSFWDAATLRARRIARRRRAEGRSAVDRATLAAELRACGLEPLRFWRLAGFWSPLAAVAAVREEHAVIPREIRGTGASASRSP